MLGQIANYAGVISRNTIIKKHIIGKYLGNHPCPLSFSIYGCTIPEFDFARLKLEPGECAEDLYQRLMSFVEDSLLRKDGKLLHNDEALSNNEEMTPTRENLVVLIWLRLIHEDLPRLVQQWYGIELRSCTLATIRPEISQALDSLLDELHSNQEVCAMRAAAAQGRSNFRPQKAPSQRNMNKSCPICKQAGRADFRHYLSTCKFLPEGDRKFMARALQVEYEIDPLAQEYNDLDLDCDTVNCPATNVQPPVTRRVAIEQSPFMDLFFKHHPTRVTLDSGATGNLIRASFAQHIGAPIQNSSQTVYQADGQSSLKVIGETNITLS